MINHVLIKLIWLPVCFCIRNKPYFFIQVPPTPTHYGTLPLNIFTKEELEACNPSVPLPKPKPPPIYNLEDPLSDFRIVNFPKGRDSSLLNLTSLPYVQIEHQDKNKLVPFKDGREILSFYSNKLNSFLSNYKEWNKAYDSEPFNDENLEFNNPISPNSYYALVFYCAWQSESIALLRAIHQLLGNYRFDRDPPIDHRKKSTNIMDYVDEYERLEALKTEYEKTVEEAKRKNLPPPPEPEFEKVEPVRFNLQIPDVDETLKILDFCQKRYNYNWWMPEFGKITYNRVVDKAFNELYRTSYQGVSSTQDRMKYKLLDNERVSEDKPRKKKRPININFVLVRLANSLMLSNSKHGVRKHRRFIQCHEKEFRFNEIMLRLLIEEEVYYEDMPLIQLFKCVEPLDSLPSVYGSKTQENRPFDNHLTFYKRNPFDIAKHVSFGLPPLRKCNHLSVIDDFVHLGNFMGLSTLKLIDSFDSLFLPDLDFLNLFSKTSDMKKEDFSRIEPVLYTLTLMYKFHMRKIVDARPKKPEYVVLNP